MARKNILAEEWLWGRFKRRFSKRQWTMLFGGHPIPLGGGAAFVDPTSISGLQQWCQASKLSLNNDDAVASFTDFSGNNYHPVQATAGKKPTFKTNILNGKPCLLFSGAEDGTGDVLRVACNRASPETIFLVFQRLTQQDGDYIIDGYDNPNKARVGCTGTNGNVLTVTAGTNLNYASSGTDTFAIWTIVFNGATSKIYKAGVEVGSGNAGTSFENGITIGASPFYAKFGTVPESCTHMNFYALIRYNKVLTTAERNNVGRWLAADTALPFLSAGEQTLTVQNTSTLITGATSPDIDWHGRSSCVTRGDGVVVAVHVDADAHVALISSSVHIKFSDDYGATWTDIDKCLDGSDVVGMGTAGEPFLFAAPNGDLILHLGRGWQDTDGGTWFQRSTDGGETWTAAAPIAITGIVGNTNYLNLIDDTFIYDGTIYLAGRIATDKIETNVKSLLVKSTDNGANWVFVSDVSNAGISNEIGIEYLGSSRIIAIMRGAGDTRTFRAFSNDMGATWGLLENITYLMAPSGRHRIFTKTHLEGGASWWEDQRLIMCGFEFSGLDRLNCVWFSDDGGLIWSPARGFDAAYHDAGYGHLFYNPTSGEYVSLNYHGDTESTFASASLFQYNFTVNW